MALRNRVKAIVMFAGVIKHRLNRTNTANILARLEDTMSWVRNFNFNLLFDCLSAHLPACSDCAGLH